MRILAVDPGPTQSAYVLFEDGRVVEFAKVGNEEMLSVCATTWANALVIEQVACMGMAVGAEVFESVFWSGRFAQVCGYFWDRVKRHEVKSHLCHHPRAKDGNIRQSLIDRYGGKDAAIGKKKTPGPLHGMSGDCWQALALAVTYSETRCPKRAAAPPFQTFHNP